MQILRAGAFYFASVFGIGFIFGIIRTLWMAPRLGARAAELIEAPLMLAVSVASARWVIVILGLPFQFSVRFGMGVVGFVFMLIAEFGLVLRLRGLSVRQYLATRDRVAGIVYYVILILFLVMPLLVVRR